MPNRLNFFKCSFTLLRLQRHAHYTSQQKLFELHFILLPSMLQTTQKSRFDILRVQNVKLVCLYCRSYRFVLLFSDSFWSCFSFVYTIKVYGSKKESLVFTFRVCVLLRFRRHGTCEQTEKNVNRVHFVFMQNLNA